MKKKKLELGKRLFLNKKFVSSLSANHSLFINGGGTVVATDTKTKTTPQPNPKPQPKPGDDPNFPSTKASIVGGQTCTIQGG